MCAMRVQKALQHNSFSITEHSAVVWAVQEHRKCDISQHTVMGKTSVTEAAQNTKINNNKEHPMAK